MADDTAGSAEETSTTLDSLNLKTRELEIGANSFARAMTSAFARAAVDGKRFEDVLKSLALRLSDLALKLALKPLTQALSGGFEKLFSGLFSGTGDKQAFASGGVIATPTYFPLGARGLGLAGEAGPEAILPLARGADGRLGVASNANAGGSTVTIHIATPDAESFRRSETYVTGLIARAVSRGQRGL
jgi:phage-related minor tail protein